LGDEGQKRLRAFLQENACCTIFATSQSLFNGIKLQTSPFYGFFRIHHLEDLTSEDATQLLANIARLEGDRELESFIQMPTGRDRIRAVHHLAGGSHRVYVIFSEFLTRESLDELVEPFMRMLDDLTPYYQARMQWLSPQQRKIIEFLCDRRHPVPVKEIAQRCFITHQTASGQLKDLREKGYVTSEAIGRESFYELREVLMRFCLEVKKQRGETIQLFVDFLRLWYSKQELQERLERLSSAEMLQAPSLEREYVLQALKAISHDSLQQHSKNIDTNATVEASDEDPRVAAYWEEYRAYKKQNNWLSALSIAEKLVAIRGQASEWFEQGYCMDQLKRYKEAIASFDQAIELQPDYPYAWYNRGSALGKLGQLEQAIASFDKAIELKPDYPYAWYNRGNALYSLGQLEQAIASYDKGIELKPDYLTAWYNRGNVLNDLGELEQAIASYDKAIELQPDYPTAWNNRGNALSSLGQLEQAIASYDKAIEIDPNDKSAWFSRGWVLDSLGRYEEALASCDKAIELGDQSSYVFFNRAIALLGLNHWDEGIVELNNALDRLAQEPREEAEAEDVELIFRNLFNSTKDAAIWKTRITTLITLYNKHQVISALGQGLVRSIPALMSDMVSDKAAQTWLEVWQELTSDYTEFQIPLRLLNTAVRYRQTKGDKRVLLELPIEERNLLKPLLGISEGGQ
jgi:tetratricopeptide (TPR) repeat protein